MATRIIPPETVLATLNYYITPENGGTTSFFPGTAGNYRRKDDSRQVTVTDLRSVEEDVSLDKQGFQKIKYPILEKEFVDLERITSEVYQETSQLLKTATGATHVHPFSHIVRRQTWEAAREAGRDLDEKANLPTLASAKYIHIDQSYDGAVEVLRDNLSAADYERLGKTRWGIVNVWRPIQTVHRDPLAVCDARSVPESDLYPVRAILPSKGSGTFEDVSKGKGFDTWRVIANPAHRWYFCSELTPEEALLIKCYDSKLDGRARRSPHTAFSLGNDSGPPRQSIEVRCLVFWENESLE